MTPQQYIDQCRVRRHLRNVQLNRRRRTRPMTWLAIYIVLGTIGFYAVAAWLYFSHSH